MTSLLFPHGDIQQIFPSIYVVTGANITHWNEVELQHSRNMTIVSDGQTLTLINTVRLNDEGLAALDALGKVENVVRLGSFHGRDDSFYLDRYQARLWALPGMVHDNNRITDVELVLGGEMPVKDASLFVFETSVHPEGILQLKREGGILITCDSIKNWLAPDEFFSAETAALYQAQGVFGPASVSAIWKQATKVQAKDFERLKNLNFKHLLSAHGTPILNHAKELVNQSV